MEKINFWNINYIVRIEIKDKCKHNYIKYFQYESCLDGTIFEGFHGISPDKPKPYNEHPKTVDNKKYIIENNIVYFKPCVSIYYVNGDNFYQTFDTYEKAIEYANEIKNKIGIDNIIKN